MTETRMNWAHVPYAIWEDHSRQRERPPTKNVLGAREEEGRGQCGRADSLMREVGRRQMGSQRQPVQRFNRQHLPVCAVDSGRLANNHGIFDRRSPFFINSMNFVQK